MAFAGLCRASREGAVSKRRVSSCSRTSSPAPPKSALDGISRSLPSLAASQEMQERAANLGYDWPDIDEDDLTTAGTLTRTLQSDLESIRWSWSGNVPNTCTSAQPT